MDREMRSGRRGYREVTTTKCTEDHVKEIACGRLSAETLFRPVFASPPGPAPFPTT